MRLTYRNKGSWKIRRVEEEGKGGGGRGGEGRGTIGFHGEFLIHCNPI